MEEKIGNYTYYLDGRIYSHQKEKFLKGYYRKNNGYNVVVIDGEKKYRHRLIAETFIPNPNNLPEVNHKDEDKTNNCADNLEWCTHEYNINYGTVKERISKAKCKQVAQYTLDLPCELVKVWPSLTDAATELKKQGLRITKQTICMVCNNKIKSAGGYGWSYWEE